MWEMGLNGESTGKLRGKCGWQKRKKPKGKMDVLGQNSQIPSKNLGDGSKRKNAKKQHKISNHSVRKNNSQISDKQMLSAFVCLFFVVQGQIQGLWDLLCLPNNGKIC